MKRILAHFIILLLLPAITHAACFQVAQKDVTIQWTAFKTPAKVGVKGKMPSFTMKGKTKGSSMKKIIKGMALEIDTTKINSGNKSRDKKIAKYFFGNMPKNTMKATTKSMGSKKMSFFLNMNGIEKEVAMTYSVEGKTLKAKGYLDILDFSASKSLKAINKACYALHSGKTWSDVELLLSIKFTDC